MKTVAFFSFKGGVGRTQALINTAYLLAQQKYFVLVVDMDIHAPGLTLMPEMQPTEPDKRKKLGLVDFLEDLLDEDKTTILDLTKIVYSPQLVISAKEEVFKGDLQFLPCGFLGTREAAQSYHRKLRKLPLNLLNEYRQTKHNTLILEEMQTHLAKLESKKLDGKKPDFLLLDARTGFTEISDLIITPSSDHIVTFFGLNEQNRKGLEIVLSELLDSGDFPINNLISRLSVVISPVPDGEESLKKKSLELVQKTIHDLARFDESRKEKEAMPLLFSIPYHPFLALTEQAIVKQYPESRPAEAYKTIAAHLEKQVTSGEEFEAKVQQKIHSQLKEVLPHKEIEKQIEEKTAKKQHPLSETIPWNWLCPEKTYSDLVPHLAENSDFDFDVLLSLLASSSSLSIEDKKRILFSQKEKKPENWKNLLSILQQERSQFLSLPSTAWWIQARNLAFQWEKWIFLLVEKQLFVEDQEAYSRLSDKQILKRLGTVGEYLIFWLTWNNSLRRQYKVQSALSVLQSGLLFFPKEGDLFRGLADLFLYQNKIDESEKQYNQALKLHQQIEDKLGIANDLLGMANLYVSANKLERAEKTYQEVLELYQKVDSKPGMANTQKGLAHLYLKTKQLKKSEKAYQDALELHKQDEDKLGMANDLSGLANLYLKKKQLNDATKSYQKSFKLYRQFEEQFDNPIGQHNFTYWIPQQQKKTQRENLKGTIEEWFQEINSLDDRVDLDPDLLPIIKIAEHYYQPSYFKLTRKRLDLLEKELMTLSNEVEAKEIRNKLDWFSSKKFYSKKEFSQYLKEETDDKVRDHEKLITRYAFHREEIIDILEIFEEKISLQTPWNFLSPPEEWYENYAQETPKSMLIFNPLMLGQQYYSIEKTKRLFLNGYLENFLYEKNIYIKQILEALNKENLPLYQEDFEILPIESFVETMSLVLSMEAAKEYLEFRNLPSKSSTSFPQTSINPKGNGSWKVFTLDDLVQIYSFSSHNRKQTQQGVVSFSLIGDFYPLSFSQKKESHHANIVNAISWIAYLTKKFNLNIDKGSG